MNSPTFTQEHIMNVNGIYPANSESESEVVLESYDPKTGETTTVLLNLAYDIIYSVSLSVQLYGTLQREAIKAAEKKMHASDPPQAGTAPTSQTILE
jgi:hypothetical protein